MEKYTILKGFHYSNFWPTVARMRHILSFDESFSFDDSCKYKIDEQSCVNKLFGVSLGLLGVHKNSARFGWTYNNEDDKFYIYKYIYIDGKLTKKIIYDTKSDKTNNYKVVVEHIFGHIFVRLLINNIEYEKIDFKTLDVKYIATLGPYFGGRTIAPHKITLTKHK